MDQNVDKLKCSAYCVLTVLIAAAAYGWTLWYYGRLYQDGALLSASQVRADTLLPTLTQNFIAALPEMLAAITTWMVLGLEQFPLKIGLKANCRKKGLLPLLAGGYLLALLFALWFVKLEPLAICYQWGYYLILIAFLEELIFRGLLPFLMEKSGVPVWAVWIIPGVLFACMHTLMPMIQNGLTVRNLVFHLLSVLGGYTVGHCGFYALRRWSGTLWLPVLVHGLLDFSSIFIP